MMRKMGGVGLTACVMLLCAFSSVNSYSKYGRGCSDIGCMPSEECVITSDSCSYSQREGKDCGTYPTCKKKYVANSAPPVNPSEPPSQPAELPTDLGLLSLELLSTAEVTDIRISRHRRSPQYYPYQQPVPYPVRPGNYRRPGYPVNPNGYPPYSYYMNNPQLLYQNPQPMRQYRYPLNYPQGGNTQNEIPHCQRISDYKDTDLKLRIKRQFNQMGPRQGQNMGRQGMGQGQGQGQGQRNGMGPNNGNRNGMGNRQGMGQGQGQGNGRQGQGMGMNGRPNMQNGQRGQMGPGGRQGQNGQRNGQGGPGGRQGPMGPNMQNGPRNGQRGPGGRQGPMGPNMQNGPRGQGGRQGRGGMGNGGQMGGNGGSNRYGSGRPNNGQWGNNGNNGNNGWNNNRGNNNRNGNSGWGNNGWDNNRPDNNGWNNQGNNRPWGSSSSQGNGPWSSTGVGSGVSSNGYGYGQTLSTINGKASGSQYYTVNGRTYVMQTNPSTGQNILQPISVPNQGMPIGGSYVAPLHADTLVQQPDGTFRDSDGVIYYTMAPNATITPNIKATTYLTSTKSSW